MWCEGRSARNDGEPRSRGARDGSWEERPPSGRVNSGSGSALWGGALLQAEEAACGRPRCVALSTGSSTLAPEVPRAGVGGDAQPGRGREGEGAFWRPLQILGRRFCLGLLRLLQQSTAVGQLTGSHLFLSALEAEKSKITSPDLVSAEGPPPHRQRLFPMSSQGGRGGLALWGLFYKGTESPPKAPPADTIAWEVRSSTHEFRGDADMQSLAELVLEGSHLPFRKDRSSCCGRELGAGGWGGRVKAVT